jgi:DNA mismatch repair ATPase MutS
MFLRPTRDIGELRRRYSVIRFCLETCNMESVNGLITSLRHISNVQPTLMNLSVGQGTAGEWKKLLTTSQHLMALSEMAASLPQNIALFCQLSQLREGRHLYKITSTIHRMVNFDESKRASRAVVNYGLDRKNI